MQWQLQYEVLRSSTGCFATYEASIIGTLKLCYCREQERIAKTDAARRETERILREQQAEVDVKKADMVKRDIQREKVNRFAFLVINCPSVSFRIFFALQGKLHTYGTE